jgi:hypothetical protein
VVHSVTFPNRLLIGPVRIRICWDGITNLARQTFCACFSSNVCSHPALLRDQVGHPRILKHRKDFRSGLGILRPNSHSLVMALEGQLTLVAQILWRPQVHRTSQMASPGTWKFPHRFEIKRIGLYHPPAVNGDRRLKYPPLSPTSHYWAHNVKRPSFQILL